MSTHAMTAPALAHPLPSPWQAMGGVLRRDLRLALRRKAEWLGAVFFFVLVAALFPLAIGPEPNTLRLIGPGVLWVAALLASMLSLGRLFEADHQDGSLEQLAMLALTLLIGTPVLSLLGAIGAALTLGVRGGGVLQSLLLLPLYVPVLVFGAGAVDAQLRGLGAQAHVSVLLALLLVAAAFSPWACAAALRLALE
jgi:heme exporter protein B